MSDPCIDASYRSSNELLSSVDANTNLNGLVIGNGTYWPTVETKTYNTSTSGIKPVATTFFWSRTNSRFAQMAWGSDATQWQPTASDWVIFSSIPSVWVPYTRQWGTYAQLPQYGAVPGGRWCHICVDPTYQIHTYDWDGLAEVDPLMWYKWGAGALMYQLY